MSDRIVSGIPIRDLYINELELTDLEIHELPALDQVEEKVKAKCRTLIPGMRNRKINNFFTRIPNPCF